MKLVLGHVRVLIWGMFFSVLTMALEWEFDTSMIGGRDGTVIVYPHAS